MKRVTMPLVGVSVAVVACLVGRAAAQSELYAVDFGGDFYSINTTTGAATVVGPTGFTRLNSAAANSSGQIFTNHFRVVGSTDPDLIIRINRNTGAGTVVQSYAANTDIRGMAFDNSDRLFVILDGGTATAIDTLARVNLTTGVITTIGMMGRSDFQGLTFAPFGQMYATAVNSPAAGLGQVYLVDTATGATTLVGGALGMDSQSIEFDKDGFVWAARINLQSVNLADGSSTTIGALGISDVRGLAAVRPAGSGCYANCDGSTIAPILNVNDFICFQARFAAGCP